MIVIAHRGASAYAPENTEAAFDLGLAQGADALETDVRSTRDGVLVLLHDARVDRTSDGQGNVANLPWSTVRDLDAGCWKDPRFAGQRIPTLEAFLDRYGPRCPLYLEIKGAGVEEGTVEAVRRRGLLDRVVFTCFDLPPLERVAAIATARLCWLVRDWTPAEEAQARAVPLSEVSINAAVVDRQQVEAARSRGLGCRAWGLTDEARMERAIAAGVDGVTIDFPDRLIRRLGRAPGGEQKEGP